jgi:acyl carrier protein
MTDATNAPRSAAEIARWMQERLAPLLRCEPDAVDPRARFETLGLDSATAVRVTLDLEDWLGTTVDPALLYDYPTIESLAEAIAAAASGTSLPPNGPAGTTEGSQSPASS